MSECDQVYQIILSLAKLFRSRCYVCLRICYTGKGFVIHHIKYISNEKKYNDFTKPSGNRDRLTYYKYLEPIIRQNKHRFALLCNGCHSAITHDLRYKKDKLLRKIRLVKKSLD